MVADIVAVRGQRSAYGSHSTRRLSRILGYTEFSGTWGRLGSSRPLVPPQRSKRIYEVKFQSDDTPTSTVPPWNLGTTNRTSRHWRSVHRCERVALYGGLDGGE